MVKDWKLVARPKGDNGKSDDKNLGGVVLLLKAGYEEHEVGRVAFERSNSLNPNTSFEDQLDIEVNKAQKAITTIAELFEHAGELS